MNEAFAGRDCASGTLLQVESVCKSYINKRTETVVLHNISFGVAAGEKLAIVGPSGAGKSTLLHILGTLDRPSAGSIRYKGTDLFAYEHKDLAAFRNRNVGFIFQFHHLLPEFSALENTMMPALIAGRDEGQARQRSRELLTRMGLGKRLFHKPGELSGGEQQRVAVARALIMQPVLILADEPTGNLDTHTGQGVFELLLELNQELGMTLIIVTHNEDFSRMMPRCITLLDGRIVNR